MKHAGKAQASPSSDQRVNQPLINSMDKLSLRSISSTNSPKSLISPSTQIINNKTLTETYSENSNNIIHNNIQAVIPKPMIKSPITVHPPNKILL